LTFFSTLRFQSSDKNLKGAARLGSWPNAATGTAMGDINSALGGKGPISEKWGDVSADNMHRTMMQVRCSQGVLAASTST
jgi:hypothetical protein